MTNTIAISNKKLDLARNRKADTSKMTAEEYKEYRRLSELVRGRGVDWRVGAEIGFGEVGEPYDPPFMSREYIEELAAIDNTEELKSHAALNVERLRRIRAVK